MGAEMVILILGGGSIPFIAYGIAGLWNYWTKRRPVDPKQILAERYARGEIDDHDYQRRLSVLTYGPPLELAPFAGHEISPGPQASGD